MSRVFAQIVIDLELNEQTVSGTQLDLSALIGVVKTFVESVGDSGPPTNVLSVYTPTKDWQIGAQLNLGQSFEKVVTDVQKPLPVVDVPDVEIHMVTVLYDSNAPSFESKYLFLKQQEKYWNHVLARRKHVFLNEVLDALGLPRTPQGALVGWLYPKRDGDGYIDFGLSNLEPTDRPIELNFNIDGAIWSEIG